MLAQGEQLLEYLPQRPPITMIDALEEATLSRIVSGLFISQDNIFVEDGLLREPGIIENIAQTAAAGVGYFQKSQGLPVTLGFIGAIRDLTIYALPHEGKTLRTTVDVVNKVFDVTIVRGQVHIGTDLIAECEMRIFIQKPQ